VKLHFIHQIKLKNREIGRMNPKENRDASGVKNIATFLAG
jgi:hypothetical protein